MSCKLGERMAQAAKAPKRKLRAIRARRRRRRQASERSQDIRSRYRERDLPTRSHIGVMTIEDPYSEASRIDAAGNLLVAAQLEEVRHADGTVAAGAPAWSPPTRPLMTVFTSLRDDPIGRMFARHQIDAAQYHAARAYQQIWDAAQIGSMGSIDMSKPFVDGGAMPDVLTDAHKRAAEKIRAVETALLWRLGFDGVSIARTVLADCKSLEQAARMHGARSEREIHNWGWLFRRALNVIAQRLGFANSMHREPTHVCPQNSQLADAADDPDYHARPSELYDWRLRHATG